MFNFLHAQMSNLVLKVSEWRFTFDNHKYRIFPSTPVFPNLFELAEWHGEGEKEGIVFCVWKVHVRMHTHNFICVMPVGLWALAPATHRSWGLCTCRPTPHAARLRIGHSLVMGCGPLVGDPALHIDLNYWQNNSLLLIHWVLSPFFPRRELMARYFSRGSR